MPGELLNILMYDTDTYTCVNLEKMAKEWRAFKTVMVRCEIAARTLPASFIGFDGLKVIVKIHLPTKKIYVIDVQQ